MPDIPNIGFAVTLKPQAAIDYFKRKGYAISFRWDDMWAEAHAHAFTVAGAMRGDVLASIRGAIDQAQSEGQTFRDFKKNLKPTLKKLGWWGRGEIIDDKTGEVRTINVTPHRLHTIYQTNMQTSYMAGRYKFQIEDDSRPFWEYIAVMDAATRPSHAARNGTILAKDDPWWDTNYPPNGWGCRCRVDTLSRRALDRRGGAISKGADLADIADAGSGWDYNPGKAALYDPAKLTGQFPAQRTWKDYGRPDLRKVPDSDRLNIEILPASPSLKKAQEEIAKTFGVSKTNPIAWIDTPIEKVAVDYNHLTHTTDKKAEGDERERYAKLALETLKNPFEVYLTRFPQDNNYRKQYIGLFKEKGALVSVVTKKDGTLLWNYFTQSDIKKLNYKRIGDALLFAK